MAILDYKKEYKDLYMPSNKPAILKIPEMTFIMVDEKETRIITLRLEKVNKKA